MRTKITMTLAAVACTMTLASAAQAATVDILAENQTTVKVTADLAGLGLSAATVGTATLDTTQDAPIFGFDITGGTADMDGNLLIEHDGSGVQLFAGALSATVGNFVVDTAAGEVRGNVNGGADFFSLFTFGGVESEGIVLNISETLSGALNATFNGGNDLGLAGEQFGFANTFPVLDDVAPVPLPASAALLGLGLVAVAATRRRKAA